MPTWYALLDGPEEDFANVKRLFASSGFTFDRMDDKNALSAPIFKSCKDTNEVIAAGMELLASINTTLRISLFQHTGLQFHGVVEKTENGAVNRAILARGVAYATSSATAVSNSSSTGKPVRSREERLVSLIARKAEIEDLAVAMSIRPLTWDAMNKVYESAKGLVSKKSDPRSRREDYRELVDRGWITAEESDSFYHTAAYHRHGYPKLPNKAAVPMEYRIACVLITKLFWCLVDELQPA